MKLIQGSGGGGKGSGGGSFSVKEAKDSLQSISSVQIIDLISEGEIGGLLNGAHSIFLDGTPLIDSDGNSNFKSVSYDSRNGTQSQTAIPGFPSAETEIQVGVLVTAATPVVRSISGLADAINVRIGIPQLTVTDSSSGELKAGEVSFKIEVNTNGGGWVQVDNDTINGKCVSKYQLTYRIPVTSGASIQVRVSRVTPDSASSLIVDKIYWDSYGQVIDDKLRYPNSALMALRVDASNFSSVPVRSYEIKGLKIKVPSNYDPESRAYTGIWDGTFQVAWSNNSAWVMYDLATNSRYGAGIPESQVDKWAFYKAAQYCDELVDDGFGAKSPRFTTNCYFQTRDEAFNLLKDLANRFRGIFYFQGGLLSISQDAPQDPTHLFTRSNVVDGKFSYQSTPKSSRYTACLVTWNDPSNDYKPAVEYVYDDDAIAEYGYLEKEITALGCTNQAEAHRIGKWEIYISQYETEMVMFKLGIEGANVKLGDIIKVQDPMKSGNRMGGRIKTATLGSVTIDDDIVLNFATDQYKLYVSLPDGTVGTPTVTSQVGRVLYFANLAQVPHDQGCWLLESTNVKPLTFRIVSIGVENNSYAIAALSHDDGKYSYIENDVSLQPRQVTSLSITPDIPTDLAITENLYESNGGVKNKVTFSWESKAKAATYAVFYKKNGGNSVSLGEVTANEIEIFDLDETSYEFSVYSVSSIGIRSLKAAITYEIQGKKTAPENVQNFSLIPLGSYGLLTWDRSVSLDVLNGGRVWIRFSPDPVGTASWKNAVDIAAALPGSATSAQIPMVTGTIMAKFVDSTGNTSPAETVIYTNIPAALKVNVVDTVNETAVGYTGLKTNMAYLEQYGGLCLTGSQNVDSITDFDSVASLDFSGGVAPSGSYEFSRIVDLGGVYTSKTTLAIQAQAVDVTDKIDNRTELLDSWTDFDGSNIDTVNAKVYMAITEDDPNGVSPNWSSWRPFFVGEVRARGFKFKLVATSDFQNHSIIIKTLSVTIDMPERTELGSNISSNVGGTAIVFAKPFKGLSTIGITARNLASGDRWAITADSVTGFTIQFFDSTGTPISRNFDYVAIGYGLSL
jgi:hypothetical protein